MGGLLLKYKERHDAGFGGVDNHAVKHGVGKLHANQIGHKTG